MGPVCSSSTWGSQPPCAFQAPRANLMEPLAAPASQCPHPRGQRAGPSSGSPGAGWGGVLELSLSSAGCLYALSVSWHLLKSLYPILSTKAPGSRLGFCIPNQP